jgi:hypothetical protein
MSQAHVSSPSQVLSPGDPEKPHPAEDFVLRSSSLAILLAGAVTTAAFPDRAPVPRAVRITRAQRPAGGKSGTWSRRRGADPDFRTAGPRWKREADITDDVPFKILEAIG